MLCLISCDSNEKCADTKRLTSSKIVKIMMWQWELSINEELIECNKRLSCYWNDMIISTFWVEYVWVASLYNMTNLNFYSFSVSLFLCLIVSIPFIYDLLMPSHSASNKGCCWGNSTLHLNHSLHWQCCYFTLIHVQRSFSQQLNIIIEHNIYKQ